jgi:hypothetical protein
MFVLKILSLTQTLSTSWNKDHSKHLQQSQLSSLLLGGLLMNVVLFDANMWESIMWARICIYSIEGAKLSSNMSSCHQ